MKSLLKLLAFAVISPTIFADDYVPGVVVDKVIHLNRSNMKTAIQDPANPLWLLKFYAPWCGHCKKMAPVLDSVAPKLAGQMAIGKIDCTQDQSFCKEYAIRGYPTLKFALDGVVHEYPGGRSEADILAFNNKMKKPEIMLSPTVADAHQFAAEDAEEGVVFLAYNPELKGESLEEKMASSLTTQVFSQVARELKVFGHFLLLDHAMPEDESLASAIASLGKLKDQPFICRLEPNVATRCYEKDMTTINKSELLEFVKAANVPTVARLGPNNFNKIGKKGRPLVIGVVTSEESKEEVEQVKKELARYATTGPEKIREKYYFGWFDGKVWAKFLQQFDVVSADLPQVFVLDVPKKTFWQNATYKLNIDDFLQAVDDGTVQSNRAGKKGVDGYIDRFTDMFIDNLPWTAIAFAVFLLAIVYQLVICITPGDDLRPPYPPKNFPEAPRRTESAKPTSEGEATKEEVKKEK